MRSPACSRQQNAIFPPHIHRTWTEPFCRSLYIFEILRAHRKMLHSWFPWDTGVLPLQGLQGTRGFCFAAMHWSGTRRAMPYPLPFKVFPHSESASSPWALWSPHYVRGSVACPPGARTELKLYKTAGDTESFKVTFALRRKKGVNQC